MGTHPKQYPEANNLENQRPLPPKPYGARQHGRLAILKYDSLVDTGEILINTKDTKKSFRY